MNLNNDKTPEAHQGISAYELARAIADYTSSYDTYEFRDNVDEPDQLIVELAKEIRSGEVDHIIKYLESDLKERDDHDGLHAAAEILIALLHQYQAQQEELGPSLQDEAKSHAEPTTKSFAFSLNISDLNELYDTITQVVNHILESGAKSTDSGNCILKYDQVAHLLSEDDFNRYFTVIAGELIGREEVLDLTADGFEGQINFVIGPEWCANYKPLPAEIEAGFEYGSREITKRPTLSERLTTGFTVSTDTSELVEIFCYADQVLPKTDRAELIDNHYNAHFVVPKQWAEEQAKLAGFKDLEEFFDEYTWDNTDGWYEKAFQDGVLAGVGLGVYSCNEQAASKKSGEELTFDQKISQAQVTADQRNPSKSKKPELDHEIKEH